MGKKTLFKVSFGPNAYMKFVDAHCHLDHPLFDPDAKQVISNMIGSGTVCVSFGTGESSNQKTLFLADGSAVFAACGQDPFHAEEDLKKHMAFLKKNKSKIVAVGEIGLDQHYFAKEKLPRQIEVFEVQLRFAEQNNLPAVIHTRKAVDTVLEILPSYNCKKVLHYFLEKKFAQKALDRECILSLPTIKSKDRTSIMKLAPLDRVLCETDSPYSWKGRNEPKNVREVYETLAETFGKALPDVKEQVFQTAATVYNLVRS